MKKRNFLWLFVSLFLLTLPVMQMAVFADEVEIVLMEVSGFLPGETPLDNPEQGGGGNVPPIREYDPTSYSYYGNEDNSDYQVEKKTNPAFETSYTNKLIRNGQLLILRDGKTYTVTGMEIE